MDTGKGGEIMGFKSILVKIFGKPKWPFAPIGLEDTNPCLSASLEWQIGMAAAGFDVGMVWYYRDGRDYHSVCYELVDGKRNYFDPVHDRDIVLKPHEKIVRDIPYRYEPEEVSE